MDADISGNADSWTAFKLLGMERKMNASKRALSGCGKC